MTEPHLEIYTNRSILVKDSGNEIFTEGPPLVKTQKLVNIVKKDLQNGFLINEITKCKNGTVSWKLNLEHEKLFDDLINGLTSNYGRSLVGLTILQLCIKKIEPSLNIRLHKSGPGEFSWEEGTPMRNLDADFIAPTLRSTNLLKYNKFGVMMSRSFAENYPYTVFYKAAIRGSKQTWLEIVECLEDDTLNPHEGLKKIISLLLNKTDEFQKLSDETIQKLKKYIIKSGSFDNIIQLISDHITTSGYPARLFEIAIHSIFQVLAEDSLLSGSLRPLSQMRSANKKFGNIGDIEIISSKDPKSEILESWDAKYGKPYLFDELGEIEDKLSPHKSLQRVGFITNSEPQSSEEITNKISDIKDAFGINLEILSFTNLVVDITQKFSLTKDEFARKWLTAYVESICQKRRDVAPIDEPTEIWVKELQIFFK